MATVGLYCGHGTGSDGAWDCGCTYNGETEANLMLPITRAAVKYLRAAGVTVYTDHNNEINARYQVAQANAKGVDLFMSIHCDWYKAASGVMPLYVSNAGHRLANCMRNAIMDGVGIGSRGCVYRGDLYELNATNMVANILETGAIRADLTTFKTKYDEYGRAIAKGICDYLGIPFNAAPSPKPNTEEAIPLYRVQSGEYGSKEDAEKHRKKLADKKIKGYVVRVFDKYRVQVGSFKSEANAKKMVKQLEDAGFKATIQGGKKISHRALAIDGEFGYASCVALQKWLGCKYDDGCLDGQSKDMEDYILNMEWCVNYGNGGSYTVELLQRKLGAPIDGLLGPTTIKFLQSFLNKNDEKGDTKLEVDGYAGYKTCAAFQKYLNKVLS